MELVSREDAIKTALMLRSSLAEGSDNHHFGKCPLARQLESQTADAMVWHFKCELARTVLAELNSVGTA